MSFKAIFLRPVAALITVFMLMGVGLSTHAGYNVKEPESCRLNFTVLSDAHIEGNNITRYNVFARSLQDVTKNRSGNDAIVFLGDNTMNGQNIENLLFHGAVQALLKDETVLTVMGNHDIGNGEGDYETLQNRWYDYTEAFLGRKLSHPYYCEVIDGFWFIVLGMESHEVHDLYISDEQYEWLEDTLSLAAESGKPVFVFSHQPCDYAVNAQGVEDGRLTDLLAAYSEEHDLFSFVGHTHMPMYLFWSFHTEDGFPETYLPRLTSLSGDDDEVNDDSGIGVEVEIYDDEVVIRARNFYTGEWKYDEYDEMMCEVSYRLRNPLNSEGYEQ